MFARAHVALPIALAGIFALSACGGTGSSGAETPADSPAQPKATAAATTAAAADNGPNFQKVRADGTKSFGHYFILTLNESDPVEFSKDLSVQVDEVGAYKPTQYASVNGTKAKKYTKYQVTVINNTAKAADLTLFSTSATDGDGDAAQVFDGENIGTAPSTPVRSGKTVHWFVAFGNDKADQAVSINALIQQDNATTSNGKLIWSK
jgi:hypothetical protein